MNASGARHKKQDENIEEGKTGEEGGQLPRPEIPSIARTSPGLTLPAF